MGRRSSRKLKALEFANTSDLSPPPSTVKDHTDNIDGGLLDWTLLMIWVTAIAWKEVDTAPWH